MGEQVFSCLNGLPFEVINNKIIIIIIIFCRSESMVSIRPLNPRNLTSSDISLEDICSSAKGGNCGIRDFDRE